MLFFCNYEDHVLLKWLYLFLILDKTKPKIIIFISKAFIKMNGEPISIHEKIHIIAFLFKM